MEKRRNKLRNSIYIHIFEFFNNSLYEKKEIPFHNIMFNSEI